MLTSKVFGSYTSNLGKAIADFIKYFCINKIEFQKNIISLETFIVSRLAPLDKNQGLQPISVGHVLRRIAEKVVMSILKDDITKVVGNLQLCGGQDAGCEATVHSMHDIFVTNKTEPALLNDDENAFSSINRPVFSHNIKHICPAIATFRRNCYNVPASLSVLGREEVLFHEATTQGNPTAMPMYGIVLTPLLKHLPTCYPERDPKMVAFTNDLTSSGRLSKLSGWWKVFSDVGPKYGYFPKPSKTIFIVKAEYESKAAKIFVIPTYWK